MEILALLILLQLKHWIADFCVQTYDQTVKKGIYGDAVGVSHTLDHILWTLLALVAFTVIHPLDPVKIIAVSIVEGFAHYHIDYFKVKFGSKDATTPRYWREFGADQLAHQLTYVIIIWYLLLQ